MIDRVLETFLERQLDEGTSLAAGCDRLELVGMPRGKLAPTHYVAVFDCRGLVLTPEGVRQADRFTVGVQFPRDLRCGG